MKNLTKRLALQRVVSAVTLGAMLVAMQTTGVFATFYRGITSGYDSAQTQTADSVWSYGQGYDSVSGSYIYGYGYGYTQSGGGSSSGSSGSSSSGSSSSGGGSTSTPTCSDANLVCKDAGSGIYKLFKDSGVSCTGGNLGKSCTPVDNTEGEEEETTTEDPVDNTEGEEETTTEDTTPDVAKCSFPNLNVSYTDTANNWAQNYIQDLSSKGIMNGNTSGLLNPVGVFEPWRDTTRTEFLKIALRAYCYEYINENTSSLTFADVNKSTWQARVIKKGVSLGIVTTNNANFRPNDTITRIEAIKMLLNVAQTRNNVYSVDGSVTTTTFSDVTTSWQAKYVEKAKQLQIIANNAKFKPNAGIKRDETAKVVYKSRVFHY